MSLFKPRRQRLTTLVTVRREDLDLMREFLRGVHQVPEGAKLPMGVLSATFSQAIRSYVLGRARMQEYRDKVRGEGIAKRNLLGRGIRCERCATEWRVRRRSHGHRLRCPRCGNGNVPNPNLVHDLPSENRPRGLKAQGSREEPPSGVSSRASPPKAVP